MFPSPHHRGARSELAWTPLPAPCGRRSSFHPLIIGERVLSPHNRPRGHCPPRFHPLIIGERVLRSHADLLHDLAAQWFPSPHHRGARSEYVKEYLKDLFEKFPSPHHRGARSETELFFGVRSTTGFHPLIIGESVL